MGPGRRLDLLDEIPDTGEIVIVVTSPRGEDDELAAGLARRPRRGQCRAGKLAFAAHP